jgi:hypothetical protein
VGFGLCKIADPKRGLEVKRLGVHEMIAAFEDLVEHGGEEGRGMLEAEVEVFGSGGDSSMRPIGKFQIQSGRQGGFRIWAGGIGGWRRGWLGRHIFGE